MRALIAATTTTLAALLAYPISCAIRPYRDCWLCKGAGHHRAAHNRALSRPCRWCKATGKRLRIGRRMWNRARRLDRETR